MNLTVVKGLQSEIFVPVTPPPVWAPVTKPLNEMVIALATAAGVHRKEDKRFNLAGDFTWREIYDSTPSSDLMVSHGGYDNSDVNKDINCMFPIDRLHELAKEGFIKGVAPVHIGFMGGGRHRRAAVGPRAQRAADLQQHLLQLRQRQRRGPRGQRAPLRRRAKDHAHRARLGRRVGGGERAGRQVRHGVGAQHLG